MRKPCQTASRFWRVVHKVLLYNELGNVFRYILGSPWALNSPLPGPLPVVWANELRTPGIMPHFAAQHRAFRPQL